jgi:hypothetical protein
MEKFSPREGIDLRQFTTVTLICGHQITGRNPPLNERSKYICTGIGGDGKRCGYNIGWRSYVNHPGSIRTDNPLVEVAEGAE